jgi:hypothetical protein
VIALFKLTHYPPQIHRERERERERERDKESPGRAGAFKEN